MQNPKSSPNNPNTIRKATLDIFANMEGSEQEIYLVTVADIAQEQRRDRDLKAYFKRKFPKGQKANPKLSVKVIDEVEILVYENTQMVIPNSLRSNILDWYHHYLLHPGKTRLEEILKVSMYWVHM
jgi:hypothetical protein